MARIWTPNQVRNLQASGGRPSWYRISNAAPAGVTEVSIHDEIGMFGVTARDFMNDLAAIPGAIELHLNTGGGEVFDGLAIYDGLKRRGNVTVVVDSLAASIGSIIAQAGTRRVMARNATMMIHDAHSGAMGDASELRAMADLLDKTSDNLASVYAERSGQGDTASWRAVMQGTQWYSAQEAVDAGLADEVAGSAPARAQAPKPPAAPAGSPFAVQDPGCVPSDVQPLAPKEPAPVVDADTEDHGNITTANAADLNTAARRYCASQGWAMEDGSYPIRPKDNHGEADLGNAISAVGRGGGSHDAIRAHITKRAKALGLADRIPESWNGAPKENSLATNLAAALRSLKGTE